eukprot:g35244.t1
MSSFNENSFYNSSKVLTQAVSSACLIVTLDYDYLYVIFAGKLQEQLEVRNEELKAARDSAQQRDEQSKVKACQEKCTDHLVATVDCDYFYVISQERAYLEEQITQANQMLTACCDRRRRWKDIAAK